MNSNFLRKKFPGFNENKFSEQERNLVSDFQEKKIIII